MEKTTTNSKILSADSTVNGSSSISVSTWFKSTSTTNSRYIWSFPNTDGGDGFNLRTAGAGSQLSMLVKDAGAFLSDTFNWSDGNWHHIVVTYDGSTLKFYTDGSLNSSHSFVTTISNAVNEFYVGAFSASFLTLGAFGSYDQTCIFDYALPATGTNSVATLYGDGTAVVNSLSLSPKPIAYYQLGDQSVDNGANYLVPNNSLSGSEGYSPYALSLDGVNDYLEIPNGISLNSSGYSLSAWFNSNSFSSRQVLLANKSSNIKFVSIDNSTTIRVRDGVNQRSFTVPSMSVNNWYNIIITVDNGICKVYLNSTESTTGSQTVNSDWSIDLISGYSIFHGFSFNFNGLISNVSIFDTDLTSTEVTEIYNQGRPSDLNTFSGTKPTAWWQLGSNSSFNTNWTCLNEGSVTGSNAVSANMTNDDIVNGVGYSANGLGTSSIEIANNAPYSTNNGLSENMDVLDRSTDVAPT
jgi:hypothetical protein